MSNEIDRNRDGISHEPDNQSGIIGAEEIMRKYGIRSDSTGVIYRPRQELSIFQTGKVLVGNQTVTTEDGQFIVYERDGTRLGPVFVPANDLFDYALGNLELSQNEREKITTAAAEHSKWVAVLEACSAPIVEETDFFLSRLVLAGRVFTAINDRSIFELKRTISESLFTNDLETFSQAEQKLDQAVSGFCVQNPKFLEYFGISEDYLFNFMHAELFIPTLIVNRHFNRHGDEFSKAVFQNISKQDISILTAFMMHRTARYLTNEAQKTAETDAEASQIIAMGEVPPDEFIAADNSRRSTYANMLGIYQDVSFKRAFPNLYSLGEEAFMQQFRGFDYFSRFYFLLKAFPGEIGMEEFTHFQEDEVWTESSVKSVVSALRKASIKDLPMIKQLSSAYGFKSPDANLRIDMFKRLEHLLKTKGHLPKVSAIAENIRGRLNDAEILRFRLYPNDAEFDEFVAHQSAQFTPQIVVDCYMDDKPLPHLSMFSDFHTSEHSPLNTLINIKAAAINAIKGKGDKKVFVSLLWSQSVVSPNQRFSTEFQLAPKSMLYDNYYTHSVYVQ